MIIFQKHVLQNRCSKKFSKFHRKIPVLESLFDGLQACNFIKKRLQHKWFPVKFAKFLCKNTFFYRIHEVATFDFYCC